MSRLISVFWGLVALAVMDVFDCGVGASDVKVITKTTDIGRNVMESCGSGYVAITCHCYGSCKGLMQPNPTECQVEKAKTKTTTIALTCLQTDEDLYYTSSKGSCHEDKDDKIISCYIRYSIRPSPLDLVVYTPNGLAFIYFSGQKYFLSDREIVVNDSGYQECKMVEWCRGCSVRTEVLCKKPESKSAESESAETGEEP